MEWRLFALRADGRFAEHFAGTGEIKPRLGRGVPRGGEHVMRAVDVRVQRREFVLERITDEALCRQVIDFVGADASDDLKEARIAFERRGMQSDVAIEMLDAP